MGCARTNNKRSAPVPSRFLQDRRSEVAKTQTLSFPIRLPDSLQAEALRLLDASRIAINQIISDLWPQLDLFGSSRTGPAWKQVERHLLTRSGHGSRQERCEMEQAGGLPAAQDRRKHGFSTLVPPQSHGPARPPAVERPGPEKHAQI